METPTITNNIAEISKGYDTRCTIAFGNLHSSSNVEINHGWEFFAGASTTELKNQVIAYQLLEKKNNLINQILVRPRELSPYRPITTTYES